MSTVMTHDHDIDRTPLQAPVTARKPMDAPYAIDHHSIRDALVGDRVPDYVVSETITEARPEPIPVGGWGNTDRIESLWRSRHQKRMKAWEGAVGWARLMTAGAVAKWVGGAQPERPLTDGDHGGRAQIGSIDIRWYTTTHVTDPDFDLVSLLHYVVHDDHQLRHEVYVREGYQYEIGYPYTDGD